MVMEMMLVSLAVLYPFEQALQYFFDLADLFELALGLPDGLADEARPHSGPPPP
jgi:hypothetical protein